MTVTPEREGCADNHKSTERVYRQDALAERRRKTLTRPRAPHTPALAPNVRWSMDFLRDTLASGRVARIFAVVDVCTREALDLAVDTSFPSARVVAALDTMAATRGFPAEIVCDNGPEFIKSYPGHLSGRARRVPAPHPAERAQSECLRRKL